MAVVKRKYRPPHTSEREFAVKNNCRLLVLTAARGCETLGEVFIKADGRPRNHDQRMSIANWLRRYAAQARGEKPLEAPGFNRDEALYAYAKAFPTGQAKSLDPTMSEIRDLSANGWFISVSGSMDDVPDASDLDDYVSDYPHEIGIVPYSENADGPLIVEPMRPKHKGLVRASWSDLAKFSSEFATNGKRLCIGIKSGYDTAAARARRARPDTQTIERLREQRDELVATQRENSLEIANLSLQLAECREDAPNAGAALDAVEEGLKDLLESVRSDYA